jgi:choline transport protein
MNYTCVVVGGFLIIELAWWFIAGKKYSLTVQRAKEEGVVAEASVQGKDLA